MKTVKEVKAWIEGYVGSSKQSIKDGFLIDLHRKLAKIEILEKLLERINENKE